MNDLVQMVFAHTTSVVLVALSILAMVGIVILSVRRSHRLSDKATRLLYLALDGRADEARIQARSESREIKPVLDALGGELAPPTSRPLVRDVLSVTAIMVLPILTVLHGLSVLMDPDASDKVPASAALLVGIALLLPFAVAAAITILEMSRRSARNIRGACITLLSKSVKTSVDAELSEALRRGANIRDPRGE